MLHHDATHFCKAAIQASSCLNALGTQSLNQGTPLCHQPGRAMLITCQQQPNAIMKLEMKCLNLSQHRACIGNDTAEKSENCLRHYFCWFCHYIFLSKLLLSRGVGISGLQSISGDSASFLQKHHWSLPELRPEKALCFAQFEENSLLANLWIFPGFCPYCRGINAECGQTGKSALNHSLQQVSCPSLPA